MSKIRVPFREFILACGKARGLHQVSEIVSASGLPSSTYFNVVKGDPEEPDTKASTRDKLAISLGFVNWLDLVQHWKKNELPADDNYVKHLAAAARDAEITTDAASKFLVSFQLRTGKTFR